jgi:peroxiredoxin Q/BCP
MSLDVGERIPEFSLATDGGGQISSIELEGKIAILYFYPKDDTSQCTKEAQAFRDKNDQFVASGAIIIGISADCAVSHDKFKKKHSLNFILAADSEANLAKCFGVWVEKSMYGKKYMGIERSTFLIDRSGLIRRAWRKVKVPGHAEEVLAAVRSL